mgnify:FL=1|tara:strand:- start:226 stop:1773 length:1548 start_codon:yes stop_codon:yes gene_type:complete
MKLVFVLFDTLNRLALGAYGGREVATPNFDRFARRAMTFDNHYVGSLPCMPARRDMHTGRLNFMHRSWGPLEPFDNSLPAILNKANVYTHLITDHFHYFEDGGATYHNRYRTWDLVRGQEFDPWKAVVDPPLERFAQNYSDLHYNKPGERNRLQHQVNRSFLRDEEDFPGPQCITKGLEFLDSNRDADNWMLQIECFDPHEPFHVPEKYRKALPTDYDGPILDWPRYGPCTNTPEEIAEIRANYNALVAMCDHHFGRLLDYFDAHDLWKDTCLVLSTDHGFLLSEHEWWGKNIPPYFEELSHIPLIMHHPAHADRAGTRIDALTQTPDLMPTMLDIFGLEAPPETRGRSILDRLDGDDGERVIAFGMHGGPVGVTDGHHTYFRYPPERDGPAPAEYTLMPTHLKSMFSVEELADATLHPPLDFTKGAPVLRVPGLVPEKRGPGLYRDPFGRFGTSLYDLTNDPGQSTPVDDPVVVARFEDALRGILKEHDTTDDFYAWLGLTAPARSFANKTGGE